MNDQLVFEPVKPFPLKGRLISGSAAYTHLQQALKAANNEVLICSAYLKADALRSVATGLPTGVKGRVLTRWQLGDLLGGSSDFEAYEIAEKLGWDFSIRLDFHGKAYAVPPDLLLVGSANATRSGFGLNEQANTEICTVVDCTDANLMVLHKLFDESIRVTPSLAAEIRDHVEAATPMNVGDVEWPSFLFEKLWTEKPPARLFVGECFYTRAEWLSAGAATNAPLIEHDRELLALSPQVAEYPSATILAHFRMSRMFRWFAQTLRHKGGELYFGDLTAELHAALLDDPAPRRVEVKALAQNLVAWLEAVQPDGLIVDRPNYSQRIRQIA